MNQNILICNSAFLIGKADNSKLKIPTATIPCHTNTSEVVECNYCSTIERFCDKQGNEMENICFQIEEYNV